MWRNDDVLEFANGCAHNDSLAPDENEIGFHGLDLYSLYDSMEALLHISIRSIPKRPNEHGTVTRASINSAKIPGLRLCRDLRLNESCEREVVRQLTGLRHRAIEYARRDGRLASDE
jgi:hypothetical protein